MITVSDRSGNGMGVGFVLRARSTEEFTSNRPGTDYARIQGSFNFALRGTFVATMMIERSVDNGVNWAPITAFGSTISFTGPCEESFTEPEDGVMYRWNCVSYTSGTVIARISQ